MERFIRNSSLKLDYIIRFNDDLSYSGQVHVHPGFPHMREPKGVLTMREYYVFILTKINSIFVSKIFSPNNVMNKQKQITTTN